MQVKIEKGKVDQYAAPVQQYQAKTQHAAPVQQNHAARQQVQPINNTPATYNTLTAEPSAEGPRSQIVERQAEIQKGV